MKCPDINPLTRVYVSHNFTDFPCFIVIRTWTYSRLLWRRSCSLSSRDSASTWTSPSFCFSSLTFKICSLLLTSSPKTKLLVFLARRLCSRCQWSCSLRSRWSFVWQSSLAVCVCVFSASEDGLVSYTLRFLCFLVHLMVFEWFLNNFQGLLCSFVCMEKYGHDRV